MADTVIDAVMAAMVTRLAGQSITVTDNPGRTDAFPWVVFNSVELVRSGGLQRDIRTARVRFHVISDATSAHPVAVLCSQIGAAFEGQKLTLDHGTQTRDWTEVRTRVGVNTRVGVDTDSDQILRIGEVDLECQIKLS
ncbi:MAG: tail completion protein gp17 [Rhodospirillaceae bacterium]